MQDIPPPPPLVITGPINNSKKDDGKAIMAAMRKGTNRLIVQSCWRPLTAMLLSLLVLEPRPRCYRCTALIRLGNLSSLLSPLFLSLQRFKRPDVSFEDSPISLSSSSTRRSIIHEKVKVIDVNDRADLIKYIKQNLLLEKYHKPCRRPLKNARRWTKQL